MMMCMLIVCNEYAKQKQFGAVKRALPSKVESLVAITGKIKNLYQVAAK